MCSLNRVVSVNPPHPKSHCYTKKTLALFTYEQHRQLKMISVFFLLKKKKNLRIHFMYDVFRKFFDCTPSNANKDWTLTHTHTVTRCTTLMKTWWNGNIQIRFFFWFFSHFFFLLQNILLVPHCLKTDSWLAYFSRTKPQTKLHCLALILRKHSGSIKQL